MSSPKKVFFPSLIILSLLLLLSTGFGCKESEGDEGEESIVPVPEYPATDYSPTPGDEYPTGYPTTPDYSPSYPVTPSSDPELDQLKMQAINFAQVWGTYSSTGNCQNIQKLLDQMGPSFRQEMEDYLSNECTGYYTGPAFRWQTEALEVVILDQGDQHADLLVVTKRQKSGETQETYYSNLIIEYTKEFKFPSESLWKVNDAYWAQN